MSQEVLSGLKDAARPLTLTFSAEEFELTPLPDKWAQLAGSNPFDTPAQGTPMAFKPPEVAAPALPYPEPEPEPDPEPGENLVEAAMIIADAAEAAQTTAEETPLAAEADARLAAERGAAMDAELLQRAEQERLVAAMDAELEAELTRLALPPVVWSASKQVGDAALASPLSELKPGMRYYGEDASTQAI